MIEGEGKNTGKRKRRKRSCSCLAADILLFIDEIKILKGGVFPSRSEARLHVINIMKTIFLTEC